MGCRNTKPNREKDAFDPDSDLKSKSMKDRTKSDETKSPEASVELLDESKNLVSDQDLPDQTYADKISMVKPVKKVPVISSGINEKGQPLSQSVISQKHRSSTENACKYHSVLRYSSSKRGDSRSTSQKSVPSDNKKHHQSTTRLKMTEKVKSFPQRTSQRLIQFVNDNKLHLNRSVKTKSHDNIPLESSVYSKSMIYRFHLPLTSYYGMEKLIF